MNCYLLSNYIEFDDRWSGIFETTNLKDEKTNGKIWIKLEPFQEMLEKSIDNYEFQTIITLKYNTNIISYQSTVSLRLPNANEMENGTQVIIYGSSHYLSPVVEITSDIANVRELRLQIKTFSSDKIKGRIELYQKGYVNSCGSFEIDPSGEEPPSNDKRCIIM